MYESKREALVEKIKAKGIKNKDVLDAMLKVERHLFVLKALELHAYEDVALYHLDGQTISQPYTVAFMTELLSVKPGDKVLEIGTGSGYQAAILLALGAKVFSIEKSVTLFNHTRKLFEQLNLKANLKLGDGTIGWEEHAPYDGIIVTAGSKKIPKAFLKQLNIGGRLVIPVGSKESQSIKLIKKISDTDFTYKDYPNFKFVPLVGYDGWE